MKAIATQSYEVRYMRAGEFHTKHLWLPPDITTDDIKGCLEESDQFVSMVSDGLVVIVYLEDGERLASEDEIKNFTTNLAMLLIDNDIDLPRDELSE